MALGGVGPLYSHDWMQYFASNLFGGFGGPMNFFRWCVHCPMGGGPTNGWRVQGMLSSTYQRSVLEWTGSIVWMRTICSLMLTFCKAFFWMRNLPFCVFNKKGGTQETCGIFFAAEKKKDFMKKNGISMITSSSWLREITNLGISRISSRLGPTPRSRYFEIGFLEQCPQVGDFFWGDST